MSADDPNSLVSFSIPKSLETYKSLLVLLLDRKGRHPYTMNDIREQGICKSSSVSATAATRGQLHSDGSLGMCNQ